MAEAGMKSASIYPETDLQPRPAKDGLRLIACQDGMEAQIWKEGELAASRWWVGHPPADEWARFLVANDLSPEIQSLEPQKLPWLDRPWGGSPFGLKGLNLGQERTWVYLALAVFCFFFFREVATIWKYRQAEAALEEKVHEMTAEVEPRLKARAKALEELPAMKELLALNPYPTQLELMAAVAEKFPSEETLLFEWNYNKGHLTFTIQGKDLDLRYFVQAYQDNPLFSDVTVEKGRDPGQLAVEMKVRSKEQSL
jgi:hypothetical protein